VSQTLTKIITFLAFAAVGVSSYFHVQHWLQRSGGKEAISSPAPDLSGPVWNQASFKEDFHQAHWTHQLELEGLFPHDAPHLMTPALGTFPALYAPRVFRAVLQEGGIRLRWRPHPKNPVEGIQYQLERWRGAQESMQVLTTTKGLEFMDGVDCEGMDYRYRISAVLQRDIQTIGNRTRSVQRASPGVTLRLEVPRRLQWKAQLDPKRQLKLSLQRPGLPQMGPFATAEGQNFAQTDWVLMSFRKGETTEVVVTSIPRFDGLGRRVIINGEPAFRQHREKQPRFFLTVHFVDPCGQAWMTQIALPSAPLLPQ